jgi:hypothetical protein
LWKFYRYKIFWYFWQDHSLLYAIEGVKANDFSDFCKVAELMKNKDHITEAVLEEIRLIKAVMNRGRSG